MDKFKYMAPPDFVRVWIYIQTEELEFFSCDWVLLCIWPMYVFEMDLVLRQAETETLQVGFIWRSCLRWRGSHVLLERSPTCFLLKKPSLFKVWARLSYFHVCFLEIWIYGSKFPILAQRVQGFCHCSYRYFIKFFLFMILLHHTTELWPLWLVYQSIALHLWPEHSKFQIFGFSCPESPVVYAHVHFNVFLGGFMLNPFKDFPFCSYECHITLWSAHEQIKLMVLDLWGTFTVEGKDLLNKMLKGLMVVYQISLTPQLRKDVFLTLGMEFCRDHWWGACHPCCFSSKVFQNRVRISIIGKLQ